MPARPLASRPRVARGVAEPGLASPEPEGEWLGGFALKWLQLCGWSKRKGTRWSGTSSGSSRLAGQTGPDGEADSGWSLALLSRTSLALRESRAPRLEPNQKAYWRENHWRPRRFRHLRAPTVCSQAGSDRRRRQRAELWSRDSIGEGGRTQGLRIGLQWRSPCFPASTNWPSRKSRLDVLLPVPPAPSGSHAPRGRGDTGSPELGLGGWRPSVVQGDARPSPACPRLLGTAPRTAGALWGRPGARGRGSRHRWPTGSRRGPGATLRADPRGAGASTAAVRGLRARALFRGLLYRARRPHRPYPARRPALPGAARQPQRPPPEPAPCRARGGPPGASSASSQQLRVDWPAVSEKTTTEALRNRTIAELSPARDAGALPPDTLGRVCLKELMEERGRTAGYDPNVDSCLVSEDLLSLLAELQEAVQAEAEDRSLGLAAAPDAGAGSYMVLHVVSCEEEFQQQKLDLLWWKLDHQAPLRQKHLVCGPVKAAGAPSTLTAPEYYKLRHAQVCKASAVKHGRDLEQDPAWTEIFSILSVATIKFEMLSTAPQSQLLLALADSSISTKGSKSGTFVMYNCARLATLFEGYKCSVEQGLYPTFPPVSSLDFSLLRDEGEWLLLFNSILPFPDLLRQTAALTQTCAAPGLHATARTEMVCKFLVQLSMDFSSYYNRVHILGEPRPHLFGQMFARLQLLRAVREVLHTGLAMLGLPPLSHI